MADALMIIASDHRRGAETFALVLADELVSRGHASTVVAIVGGRGDHRLDVEVAGSSRWDPRGLGRLVRLARGHDVVVGHGSSALLNGCVAAAIARRPFVYRNIGDPTTWGDRLGANLRIGAPLRRAAAVAALYEAAKLELCRRYRLEPERVRTIPNGAPVERFGLVTAAARAERRRTLGLDPQLRWAGCVGALSEEKRVHLAVELVGRHPHLGLVIAGEGPARAALEALAERVAPGRVVFLGSVDDPTVAYEAVDVLVLPSRTEGLPAVAIEAGLCGVPVVAARVGGLPEIVEDGITGRIVDATDVAAFDAAVEDALERGIEYGAAARELVLARYSMDQVADAWAGLLDDVVSDRTAPRPTPGT